MPKEDENDILYINLPIQIVSGTNGNDIGYHNILLKKLPDGNYVVEPNQIILQDEDNLQRNESYMFSSDVEHPQAKDVPKNIGLTISKNSNKTQKSFEQETCNEICQIPSELNGFVSEENTLLPENHNTFKVHKVVEETPLEKKYQNNKQILQKGPGRPRKDGTVRPRIERLGPFQCSFCDKEYDLYAELRKHEKQHIKEKTYQCSKCNASFNLMCNYRLHMATHETELHSCPECQKIFSRQASLRAHLMLHCVDDNILCVNCGVSVETQALLEQHKKACVEEKSYPGKENLLSLNSENTDGKKTNHGKLKHGKKLNCSICKKYFKKPSQLERHFRCHTGEKPYKCHICNRGFSQKGSLIIHRVKHTGAKPYSCTSCPAKFAQKGNLVAHRKRVHPVNIESVKIGTTKKVFSCQKCSCVFKRLGSLNSHMNKLHSPANISTTENSPMNNIKLVMNQLSELQNMTSNIDVLQQAVNNSGLEKKYCAPTLTSPKEEPGNHTVNNITVFDNLHGDKLRCYVVKQRKIGGIKWRQCNYCTREFRKPSDLIRHLRIHTKEKPFKCPQCYRRFTVKSTLTAHLKTHTGLKTFVCPICQKLFSSSSSLKVHTRLHTGTKPFICRECDRSFRTSSQLQTHFATNCTSDNNPKICDQQIVEQTSEIEEAKFNDSSSSEHYYICTTCGRSFHDENILNDHLLTHTSLDTFKCLVSNCSMYFNTASALKHMEKHNEVKYYICPSCPKTFKTKVNCREHTELHKENENLEQYTIARNTKLQKNCESIQSQPTAFTHFLITSNDNIITTKQEKCVENMKEDNCTNEDIKQNFNSAILDHVLPISNCIMLPKDLNIITKSDHYSGERVVIDNTSSANLFQVSGILQSTEGTNMQNVVSVKSDPNISLNDYSSEETSIPLFTSNNQSTLLVTTKSLNDQPVNALSNMNANAQENVASYLISNLQYSNQNSTNNDEETEQNASLCKYFNENSVKSPVNVITNNILLKNLMVNFQNQFDILCLDDQGSSLDILGEENCIQDEQNYISEQQDQMIISPASPSFTHSCVDDVQPVDFSCGNRESSEQVECQNDQIDEFGENVQCTGNVLQETSENDMGRGRNMEPQFEMKYVPDIEDNYSTNSLRTFSHECQ
ncbi:zinc finger protein 236-like [Ctenocephalides felis]|uniref:zinc finger protein 236-like n=1 Tax=Ctenocephalides felis TaxID=7515 RepID=UPI000E6E10F5|nr:zinc finger protein 236-like [Ctenocephalides felis]